MRLDLLTLAASTLVAFSVGLFLGVQALAESQPTGKVIRLAPPAALAAQTLR
jgi:hypothetical protein